MDTAMRSSKDDVKTAHHAALRLCLSCNDIILIAHGKQPRGIYGLSESELVKEIVKRRGDLRPLTQEWNLEPNVWPSISPAVRVGNTAGRNFHWAIGKLAANLDLLLGSTESQWRLANQFPELKSIDHWWPIAAAEIATWPLLDLDFVMESLVAEYQQCIAKMASTGSETIAKADQIPSEHRTKPLTIKEAAILMGYPRVGSRHGKRSRHDERLRAAMNQGRVSFEKLGRQAYVFDKREFPVASQGKLSQ